MTAADFCAFSETSRLRYHRQRRTAQISPDKDVVFPFMYLPKFTLIALGGFGLRHVRLAHPAILASNWVRVP